VWFKNNLKQIKQPKSLIIYPLNKHKIVLNFIIYNFVLLKWIITKCLFNFILVLTKYYFLHLKKTVFFNIM